MPTDPTNQPTRTTRTTARPAQPANPHHLIPTGRPETPAGPVASADLVDGRLRARQRLLRGPVVLLQRRLQE
ncbi:hypothetical protein ACFU6R_18140, partial [Streptomyces sp. NPDC057499]|uniref:hypothetical protein n=1 Tax=Streptomyces sp. NPDC057499 TaxID=3346150 RepID=UPI0036A60A8C